MLSASRSVSLFEMGRRLLDRREPAHVLREIHEAIVYHLAPDHACLLAVGVEGDLHALHAHNLDLSGGASTWPLSKSVLAHVRESGLAVLASDIRDLTRFKEAGSIQRFRIRSVMCVPLGRPARGLVYLDNRSERPFGKEDLEFLGAAAGFASLVLERAHEKALVGDELARSSERLSLLQAELLRHEIVGRSPALLAAYDALRRFAQGGARVLLRGETGTGKELFARAYAVASGRAKGPWMPVPIPVLAPGLVESELFGHVRGAFTEATRDKKGRLELAHEGVLFLDEIGDVEPALQAKLLRFLDSGELVRVGDTQIRHVDALVVAATHQPLEAQVAGGRFRGDLLARLGQVVTVPPLRERGGDISLLAEHFLERLTRGRPAKSFAPEALQALQGYAWPLNVRELQQVVERAVCLVDRDVILPSDLPEHVQRGARAPSAAVADPDPPGPLRRVVEAAEREHILRALGHTKGNRRRAIELLQIAPETFYRRLEEYGIPKKD
jgi:two-component system, NtrC family, response regulator AtoC